MTRVLPRRKAQLYEGERVGTCRAPVSDKIHLYYRRLPRSEKSHLHLFRTTFRRRFTEVTRQKNMPYISHSSSRSSFMFCKLILIIWKIQNLQYFQIKKIWSYFTEANQDKIFIYFSMLIFRIWRNLAGWPQSALASFLKINLWWAWKIYVALPAISKSVSALAGTVVWPPSYSERETGWL